MPILHFSGKFKYQPPTYNNEPGNPERYFDSSISPDDVHKNITQGVEPLTYFEFEFSDVFIRRITYNDGTSVTDEKNDPAICKKILLKGLLVDTAPHLERGRLFAGEVRVIDLMMARLEIAVQSDLFRTIRNEKDGGAITLSADFEGKLYDLSLLQNSFISSKNSRFLRECTNEDLKMYFQVSQFSFEKLEGTIHGYLGPQIPEQNSNAIRISKRRMLITPDIDIELKNDLGLEDKDTEFEGVFRYDLEGTYEILEDKRLILLRFLNFITFTDLSYSVPKGYRFFIVMLEHGKKIEAASKTEILLDPESISKSGGVYILQYPNDMKNLDRLSTEVVCTKNDAESKTLMKEPEFDLLLDKEPNYLVLSSGEEKELGIKIFQNNRLLSDINDLELIVGKYEHEYSPLVAWPMDNGHYEKGIYVCNIQARNLENSEEVGDPIYGVVPDSEPAEMRVKISGDLPWDRYYGNYISIRLKSKGGIVIQQNIPVRVLHSVPIDKLKPYVIGLDKEIIQEVVTKLMSYYTRYFPWLHVNYEYINTKEGPKKTYQQFLKIKESLSFISEEDLGHWHSVHESVSKINHLLERLERHEHDWKKMPRSRDFPSHGVEFLRMWKAAMVDKLVDQVKNQKLQILESERSKNSSIEIDMTNLDEVQNIINGIDGALENLPDGYKKLFLIWKLQILDQVVKELNVLKTQTKHTHTH